MILFRLNGSRIRIFRLLQSANNLLILSSNFYPFSQFHVMLAVFQPLHMNRS